MLDRNWVFCMQKPGLPARSSFCSTGVQWSTCWRTRTNTDAEHLPAWKAFNQSVGSNGSVGIWHETYAVSAGRYENIYVNMPSFGLAKAGALHTAEGRRQSARSRLHVQGNDA